MYQETASDLERKWVGSYCRYGSEMVYLESIATLSNGTISGVFSRSTGSGVSPIDPTLFAPIDFPNGLYNVPFEIQAVTVEERWQTGCWRYHRNPKRSPMRGVTRSTHCWRDLGERLFNHDLGLHWSFDLLNAVLNPVYVNYHQAFEEAKTKKTVAVDRGWAISLSPTKDTDGRHLFASMYGFCGWAYPDRIVIKHRGSYQEALDFVQRSRLGVPVIYAD